MKRIMRSQKVSESELFGPLIRQRRPKRQPIPISNEYVSLISQRPIPDLETINSETILSNHETLEETSSVQCASETLDSPLNLFEGKTFLDEATFIDFVKDYARKQ